MLMFSVGNTPRTRQRKRLSVSVVRWPILSQFLSLVTQTTQMQQPREGIPGSAEVHPAVLEQKAAKRNPPKLSVPSGSSGRGSSIGCSLSRCTGHVRGGDCFLEVVVVVKRSLFQMFGIAQILPHFSAVSVSVQTSRALKRLRFSFFCPNFFTIFFQ